LIKLINGQPATLLTPYMKLHLKFMWERFATAIKIDRIPLFDLPEADKCLLASGEFDVH
jgi:hypothetical protein